MGGGDLTNPVNVDVVKNTMLKKKKRKGKKGFKVKTQKGSLNPRETLKLKT